MDQKLQRKDRKVYFLKTYILLSVFSNRSIQGAKKWDLFYDQYLHQIKHNSAGYIFYLKGWIHTSVWSTKKFLYDIRKPRYKQIKAGYQNLKKMDIRQSRVMNSRVPYYLAYFLAPLYCTENGLNMKQGY